MKKPIRVKFNDKAIKKRGSGRYIESFVAIDSNSRKNEYHNSFVDKMSIWKLACLFVLVLFVSDFVTFTGIELHTGFIIVWPIQVKFILFQQMLAHHYLVQSTNRLKESMAFLQVNLFPSFFSSKQLPQ